MIPYIIPKNFYLESEIRKIKVPINSTSFIHSFIIKQKFFEQKLSPLDSKGNTGNPK